VAINAKACSLGEAELLAIPVRGDALDNASQRPSSCPFPAQARLGELAILEYPHPQADAEGRRNGVATGTACSGEGYKPS
jgi:hypothetical protein